MNPLFDDEEKKKRERELRDFIIMMIINKPMIMNFNKIPIKRWVRHNNNNKLNIICIAHAEVFDSERCKHIEQHQKKKLYVLHYIDDKQKTT